MFEPCYFSVMPSRVRYDDSLCPNEKILFSEISSLCNTNGYCFAKNEYFAKLYKVHKNTISKWISHLKNKGYIRIFYTYKNDSKAIDKRMIAPGEKAFMPIVDKENLIEDTSIENFEAISEENQNLEESIDDNFDPTPKPKAEYPLNQKLKDNNIKYINNIDRSIYKNFERKLKMPITPVIKTLLDEWLKFYKCDVLEYAIDIAIENDVPKISYINGILRNWTKSGYKNLEDIPKTNIEIPELSDELSEQLDEILDWDWFEEGGWQLWRNTIVVGMHSH